MPPRPPRDTDPPRASRRMKGFEPAASLVAERIRTAGASRGFAVARILTHWAEIVGPDIARMARPAKLGHSARRGEGPLGATLTLLVSSAHAPVVQMQIPRIIERVNACYGHAAISRITLTQTTARTGATGFAEPAPAFAPAPPADPAVAAQAAAASEGVQDDGLRAALERLAAQVLARDKATRRQPPAGAPRP